MTMKRFSLLVLVLTCMAGTTFADTGANQLQVTLLPNEILMGATYNGQSVAVSGTIPADTAAIIRVTGHLEESKLKKKGRALGILWMNQGAVEISNVPNVFQLYLPKGIQTSPVAGLPPELGLEAIRKQAHIKSEEADPNSLFQDFVKLKEKAGLYATIPDAVGYTKGSKGMTSFQCTLSVPSNLRQGTYQVELFAVKDGRIVSSVARELVAREVGMPAFISSLAYQHGTLYGVLAVLVAAFAGLLTGVIFKGGSGAH